MEVAGGLGARSVALPNISTGIFRFPKPRAADIAIEAVRDAVQGSGIERVIFVCFDDENEQLYRARV